MTYDPGYGDFARGWLTWFLYDTPKLTAHSDHETRVTARLTERRPRTDDGARLHQPSNICFFGQSLRKPLLEDELPNVVSERRLLEC